MQPDRRRLLAAGVGACCLPACVPAISQVRQDAAATRTPVLTQIVDMSIAQQDVTKDFLVGWRTAWQDASLRGAARARGVRVDTIETDGSAASAARALRQALDNPDCIALAGCTGDAQSRVLAEALARQSNPLGMIAPWMHHAAADGIDSVAAIFASRAQQLSHAMRSLSVMGVSEVGVVHAGADAQGQAREDMLRAATGMGLRVRHMDAGDDLLAAGQRLPASAPAVLIFTGGTPELVTFTQGLARQSRQRYVIALADVNLQTVMQMGAARHTALITTQVVPLVTSSMPLVRGYRERLARLFDEPPTPLSLSGYVAARYTLRLLAELDANPSRTELLGLMRRRNAVDIDGLRIAFDTQGHPIGYVTQSMLSSDGRILG